MHIVSVNVGQPRPVQIEGRRVLTAIGKAPVAGPVAVGRLGLAGDAQADPSVHGGLAKAVYLYPQQHYPFWQTVRAQAGVALWDEPLPAGALGENLTVAGLAEDALWMGDELVVGHGGVAGRGCVLAVSEPRYPCFKFNAAMGFKHAAKLMWDSGWCGAYLAVLTPGTVAAGDTLRLEPGPREVSLRELFGARRPR